MKKQYSKHEIPNTNKGITLIALVITIIVMLILVAVTITIAVNGGLFEYAGRAGTKTNGAIANEQEFVNLQPDMTVNQLINKYTEVQGGTGDETQGEELKSVASVGDFVDYTPGDDAFRWSDYSYSYKYFGTTGAGFGGYQEDDYVASDYQGAWRVLHIDNEGYVYLMSASSVGGLVLRGYAYGDFEKEEDSILKIICSKYVNNDYALEGFAYKDELGWDGIMNVFSEYWADVEFWADQGALGTEDAAGLLIKYGYVSYVSNGLLRQNRILENQGTAGQTEISRGADICPIIKLKPGILTSGKNKSGEWVLKK